MLSSYPLDYDVEDSVFNDDGHYGTLNFFENSLSEPIFADLTFNIFFDVDFDHNFGTFEDASNLVILHVRVRYINLSGLEL